MKATIVIEGDDSEELLNVLKDAFRMYKGWGAIFDGKEVTRAMITSRKRGVPVVDVEFQVADG